MSQSKSDPGSSRTHCCCKCDSHSLDQPKLPKPACHLLASHERLLAPLPRTINVNISRHGRKMYATEGVAMTNNSPCKTKANKIKQV